MTGINRRKFMLNTAVSLAGVMALRCSAKREVSADDTESSFDLMKEVMSYRKIDSHAHVYFTDDSPETQIDFADRLGIEKLVISRPMAPGSKGLPEEFRSCNELALKDVIPIIREVPDAKYLIVNVANSTTLSEEEVALFKKSEVVMDTSGRNIIDLGVLLHRYGTNKFAFGTHAPILDDVTGLLRIEALRDTEADQDTKALLRSGNAKRLLGL